MRERTPLKENTELRFTNTEGGDMVFVVTDVVGYGGSCLVYNGYYRNHAGGKNVVRIKECYPYSLHLKRGDNGELLVTDKEQKIFEEYKSRMRVSFDVANEFHESAGLTNVTTNVFDRYEGNETVYVVESYVEGTTLSNATFTSLAEVLKTVISVGKSIEKIHDRGYLYLDIKPENILIYPETSELVQLFDFDSMLSWNQEHALTEYRVSYSNGFAPLEQRTGNRCEIGKHTDVYSLGALLFYLLFERTPKTMDCGVDVEYDYTKMVWDELYQNRVYKELTTFFHHTLQIYFKDRYPDMHSAIVQLEEIEKYSAMPVPFICSTHVQKQEDVVGREGDCTVLSKWYQSGEKVLFVSGMGGIGKSTIVRKFLVDHGDIIDNIVYLQYKHSLLETIVDDSEFAISGCEKDEEESAEEYFIRKMHVAKVLAENTQSLLVIDNYEGMPDEIFLQILDANLSVIVVTRSNMEGSGYRQHKVKALSEKKDLKRLFENNMGTRLDKEELQQLDEIVEMVEGHTLTLVLIARQIAKSYLTLQEASHLLRERGVSAMAPEKVEYVQDGALFYDRIASIIRSIFDISNLSYDKRKCLKILTIFVPFGIKVEEFRDLLEFESYDEINELEALGWLEIRDRTVQMHPLIQETIRQLEWTEEYRRVALREMNLLHSNLQSAERVGEQVLSIAKAVLTNCGNDSSMQRMTIYKELMFSTLMHLPKDQERFIIEGAEQLISDSDCINPDEIIELYDYLVYLLCQKEAYEMAKKYLVRAWDFAEMWKDPYIYGRYYDMLGDFYDSLLNGEYCSLDSAAKEQMKALWKAQEQAIRYMKKAKHKKAKDQHMKYLLSQVLLMIRRTPEKKQKSKRWLRDISSVLEKNALEDVELHFIYNMAWAWYYTLCEAKEESVLAYLYNAYKLNEQRSISDLDWVDDYYIPAANMMFELGNAEQALDWLTSAYDICSTHEEVVPYVRKMRDLLSYQLEVCQEMEDAERKESILEKMK